MAGAGEAAGKKEAQPTGGIIMPILLLLALGGGAGFGYGLLFGAQGKQEAPHASSSGNGGTSATPDHAAEGQASGKSGPDWRNEDLVPIQPIVVKLSGSSGKWLRLEGAVAFSHPSKQDRGAVMAQLGEDLMLFLGSTGLELMISPTGLEFLRDDMNAIVRSRTNGEASRLVLKSLVVE